ncbi:MAG: glycosyltransferase family 39 protein [Elusimicrobia bacterium]|nr:glycosyltransferase family 39 protein [Elusimicrobiota bacterium]
MRPGSTYTGKAVIASILLFYVLNFLVIWKGQPNIPSNGRSMIHYNVVTKCIDFIEKDPVRNTLRYIRNPMRTYSCITSYAPAFVISAAFVTEMLGRNYMAALAVLNTYCLLLLLVSVYLAGREMYGKNAGVLAALIIALYPNSYLMNKIFTIDYPLMGHAALSFYLILKSDFFADRKWSFIFFLSAAVGMMIKYTYGLFLLGPVIVGVVNIIERSIKGRHGSAVNFAAGSLLCLLLISPFYANGTLVRYLLVNHTMCETDFKWYDLNNLKLFTSGLWEEQLSPPFFILLMTGIYFFLKEGLDRKKTALILFSAIPYITIMMMAHFKTVRYLGPVFPAFALISTAAARRLLLTVKGRIFLSAVVFLGLIQFFDFYYELKWLNHKRILTVNGYDIVYFRTYPFASCIWNYKTPAGRRIHMIILDNFRKKLVSCIESHKNEQEEADYSPMILLPPDDALDFRDKGLNFKWVQDVDCLLWFDGINIRWIDDFVVLPEGIIPGDTDFIFQVTTADKPYLDLGHPLFFKHLKEVVDISPAASAGFMDNYSSSLKKISARLMKKEILFAEEGLCSVFLYTADKQKRVMRGLSE